MKRHHKTYLVTVSILFIIVAILHLVRVLAGWPLIIGGTEVPAWLSVVVVMLLGYLAARGLYRART